MQNVEFTAEELNVLRETLRQTLKEIDIEVFRTDTHEFKEMLKHRREILQRIVARLSSVPQPA